MNPRPYILIRCVTTVAISRGALEVRLAVLLEGVLVRRSGWSLEVRLAVLLGVLLVQLSGRLLVLRLAVLMGVL